jgi:glycosyltransferase involved in cell wall biosynthesis
MKILFIVSSLSFGGAEKQTILDANMMAQENMAFLLFFTDGPQKEIIDTRVKLIHFKKQNYIVTAIKLAKLIKQNNIQLIHSSLFASMIISALSSLFCKVKVVWHFHSHEYELPWCHTMAFKILARLPQVRKICFVNQELIHFYQARGLNFPPHKITLLYNSATIHPSEGNKTGNKNILIGYAGRLVSLKRAEYLIELAQYLVINTFTDFQIRIVGDGDQRNLLEQGSSKNGLQKYISFVGFQKEVEPYYRSFDLFVNPSREECLSIALIDAGVCGIPSVAFDTGGNNEIIINSQTGYIVNTKEEFFEKVLILLHNNTLRDEMGKKAKEHCLKHFSREVHLSQLKSLYKEVLG